MCMKDKIFVCGDLHGNVKDFLYRNQKNLENSNVICVGDFGIGFGGPHSSEVLYDDIKKYLESNNIMFYTIRGNHDNPEFFDTQHDFPLLKFIPDHKVIDIGDHTFYSIGGGTSIDIDTPDDRGRTRRKINDEYIRYGSSKRIWWPEENIVQITSDLPIKVDYIISHEAPLNFSPISIRTGNISGEVWEKMMSERNYLQWITTEINAKWWFYGHYHRSYSGHYGNLMYRGLGIEEIFEVPQ